MTGPMPSGWLSKTAWAALCVFVFSIPWEKSIHIQGATTLSHMLGVIAFAAAAVAAERVVVP